jgi:signal transduction histidine kinase/CheY-like chemotaxis protein
MAAGRSFSKEGSKARNSAAHDTPRGGAQRPSAPETAPVEEGSPPQAGVIVDTQFEVMQFLGNTSPYLQLPVGRARLNLRLMLCPGLQHPVLEAVREVCKGGAQTSHKERLALVSETGVRRVNVAVARLDRHPSGKPAIRVLFHEAQPPSPDLAATPRHAGQAGSGGRDEKPKDVRVARLKDELLVTRSTLESIIEEQEIGTARLKSAYYQLESVNAKLEATNEELAAANAELEALNEQLAATVRERDEAERERQRMEAGIIQSQRLESLRVMAGGVAHDFNNLLTSIIGNANVLADALPRDSETWDAAEQIEKAGQHAAGLVKQMLAFCGKGDFATEPLNLSNLVGDSVDLLRASVSKTAEVRCELAEELPPIEGDPTQVRQVLVNLVVNASEAIGNVAGVIRISTRRLDLLAGEFDSTALDEPLPPGAYVCLEVSDTGRGMSAKTQAKLFEPFFSTKFAGRGLGMAAVLGIVRGHRGSIAVRSRQAQGTKIETLFPVARRAALAPDQPGVAADWRGRGAVLVVDDEESVRNVAKAILRRAGLQVVTVAGGREALAVLRRAQTHDEKVGAVLLDLVMPQMGGKEVLEQLRTFAPALPVILSSGYAEESEAAARMAALGPTTFLPKPYRPSDLLGKVRQLLSEQLVAAGKPGSAPNQDRADAAPTLSPSRKGS